ncbi:hypothetical protein Pfo_006632 [Paulownia fortunei]|nr:hypothetical protein Pfo_006632 [Paulownia fortunei]
MMGPSCRRRTRSTRKSSSRRRTLFKNSKNQENSVVVSPANSPAKPSNDSSKVDASKDVENVDVSYNTSACSTPKAERFRIPEINTCPPAPKKRRIVRNFSLRRTTPTPFFAPPDIELFFYLALRGIPV